LETIKSFETLLYHINDHDFERIALSVFKHQATHNATYDRYLTNLGVAADRVQRLGDVPFMPIQFFKGQNVATGDWSPERVFLSSGTTLAGRSRHPVQSVQFYLQNAQRNFEMYYGALKQCAILALLPGYSGREDSSLITMINHFIAETGSPDSSFYLGNIEELTKNLMRLRGSTRKIMLWGVSFALLDLAEQLSVDLSHCVVMETGGMKGRRKELVRAELHDILCRRFNVAAIHSEYGMTELFSQGYSKGQGYFVSPPWMKVMVREINDPFASRQPGESGVLKVVDLANLHTCSFIETEDLGRAYEDGRFEVLGRLDNSDVRGCNLLV
jgi:hypothetical protein